MTYVVIALIATNILAVLVAVFLGEKVKSEHLQAEEIQVKLNTEVVARQLAVAVASDEKKRLEDLIAYVKNELQKAEVDLARCSSPAAVRSRLNGLFLRQSVPPAATPADPSSGAGVPQGSPTKP